MAFPKIFFTFMFLLMSFYLMMRSQSSSQINWEYLIYCVLILVGCGCSGDSIKEHFCEKIFTSKKSTETPTVD